LQISVREFEHRRPLGIPSERLVKKDEAEDVVRKGALGTEVVVPEDAEEGG